MATSLDNTPSTPGAMLRRVVVLNSKGGSGKTTLATNLAAMLSMCGQSTVIFDYDKQASSMVWLKKRHAGKSEIAGIEAFRPTPPNVTRSWFLRVPPETHWAVLDTPAGVDDQQLRQFVAQAHVILIPVMPSPSDIHAVTRFIERLFIAGRVKTTPTRIGIVANRVKLNRDVYRNLRRFLDTLKLPVVAELHDSHNYVQAAMEGVGVAELPRGHAECDAVEWQKLYAWITGDAVTAPVDPADVISRRSATESEAIVAA